MIQDKHPIYPERSDFSFPSTVKKVDDTKGAIRMPNYIY